MKNKAKKLFCMLAVSVFIFGTVTIVNVLTLNNNKNTAVYNDMLKAQTVSADEDIYTEPNIVSEPIPLPQNDVIPQNDAQIIIENTPQNNTQSVTQEGQTPVVEVSPVTGQSEDGIVLVIMLMMLTGLTLIRINSKSEN